jgi:hypothetical protein
MEFETRKVGSRYVIVEKGTEKVLDDAQGYGYKTAEGAHKAGWFKFQRGNKKIASDKTAAKKFWKQHPDIKKEFVQSLEYGVKELSRGEITEAGIISDLEKQFGIVIPKAAIKYLVVD